MRKSSKVYCFFFVRFPVVEDAGDLDGTAVLSATVCDSLLRC